MVPSINDNIDFEYMVKVGAPDFLTESLLLFSFANSK
jgi:hypothetical protein